MYVVKTRNHATGMEYEDTFSEEDIAKEYAEFLREQQECVCCTPVLYDTEGNKIRY